MSRKANKLQIVKNRLALQNWGEELARRVEGKCPRIIAPRHSDSDLLAVYPMGDPHFGMYAWAAECGDDFDLKVAERLTYAAIDALVASAPPAKEAVIIELGDFFHSDSNAAATTHGTRVDVDTRFDRVQQIGQDAMVYVIKAALRRHEKVTVRIVQGNHDEHSSLALRRALAAYFRNEKRIRVDLSPAPFWFHRFGRVLIGATHGHTCKPQALPSIMATDAAAEWGDTDFRYFYRGHVHHDDEKEYPGCKVQSFRTLAAKDAWHAGAGYRSWRDMKCVVMHRKYGEVQRLTWPVAMLGRKA